MFLRERKGVITGFYVLASDFSRAAPEITRSQSWDYWLRSQKELLLGKAECLANSSVCICLLWGATLAAAVCWLALSLALKL